MDELNATQGSLLGFLHDEPKTGWDLVREIEAGLDRFWNVTSSHVYRELRAPRGLRPGHRRGRPGRVTAVPSPSPPPAGGPSGGWIAEPPGPEQIRFPLLVKLWFARHLEADRLAEFFDAAAKDHEGRLSLYRDVEGSLDPGDDRTSVVRFGIAYEQAVLDWLGRPEAERPAGLPAPGVAGR